MARVFQIKVEVQDLETDEQAHAVYRISKAEVEHCKHPSGMFMLMMQRAAFELLKLWPALRSPADR